MNIWFYTLISVSIVSLIGLIGVFFLSIKDEIFQKVVLYFVSFSTGALFGDTFIHIFPEVSKNYGFGAKTSVPILLGIVVFFVLEKFIFWQHCHTGTSEHHPHPVAYTNLVGDGVHNFIDGMIIAGSFMADIKLGIATTFAVILHEIPTEMGHFSILVYAGFSKKRALGFNFLSALAAVIGGVVTLSLGRHISSLTPFLLSFTAGGFIYLAGSDFITKIKKEHDP
ncbi:MAG: ZIP family metal transporter, partial [Deltaproteobacteria bacterium]|nr:ZIP family metal transporter [Deltaproteobacteria bacterium]